MSVGSEIAATVAERAFYSLEAPVLRVSGFDAPFPPAQLEDVYLPDADRVLDAVDRSLAYCCSMPAALARMVSSSICWRSTSVNFPGSPGPGT